MRKKLFATLLTLVVLYTSASSASDIILYDIATCLWKTLDDLNEKGELNEEDNFETFLSVYESFSNGIEHKSVKEKQDVLDATVMGATFFCVDDLKALQDKDVEDLIPAMIEVYQSHYKVRGQ